jgi:cytochrome c oxidase assembly protein subunit 15
MRSGEGASRATAVWLFAVAALVFAMVVVGGATRLTDSGLSITEWRPVTGAVPPLSAADWASEFEKYRRIPQYRFVNAGMSLEQFKTIYWWEWGHRFLGRLIGLVYAVPFAVLLLARRIPRRLLPATVVLFVLGGLQGFVGWWMVSSGLSERVDVAPERLTTHLGLALLIFAGLVWTGLNAWSGRRRGGAIRGWAVAAWVLLALVYVQILLGGLVAGNDAGMVHTDWPRMSGRWFPADYAGEGLWGTLAHSQAAVQLHHRLGAYLLFAAALAAAVLAFRSPAARRLRPAALALAVLVSGQALLGIVTLMHAVPLSLGVLHQCGAVLVLGAATVLAWRARRGGANLS